MKAYSHDALKYSECIRNSFEKKFKFFYERCEHCSVSVEEKSRAFALMVSGVGLDYYFTHVKNIVPDCEGIIGKI